MKYPWSRTVVPIAVLFSFRMLGLFLLIPIFTLYAGQLTGATPTLIGFALGSYGLTQGLLQIPFGMLSDRLGRKPVITFGLILFACGSLCAALTHSVYGMILARTLQGAGAIGSVLIALLADLTPENQRTKAMAVLGMTIGASFGTAMVLSPILTQRFGLASIFYLTFILASFAIVLLHAIIPNPAQERFHPDAEAKFSLLQSVVSNPHLQRLNLGIFCQHCILTSTFFAIPIILRQQIQQGYAVEQWHFYLSIILCSFLLMIPLIILAEKKQLMKSIFLFSVLLTGCAQGSLASFPLNGLGLYVLLLIYFLAFNFLEASLPSLISKQANANSKGTAMGVYSTAQFLGIFVGGSLAGLLYQWRGNSAIFIANTLITGFWFLISLRMEPKASSKN